MYDDGDDDNNRKNFIIHIPLIGKTLPAFVESSRKYRAPTQAYRSAKQIEKISLTYTYICICMYNSIDIVMNRKTLSKGIMDKFTSHFIVSHNNTIFKGLSKRLKSFLN